MRVILHIEHTYNNKISLFVTIQNQPEALAAEGLHFVSVRAKRTSPGCPAPYESDSGVQGSHRRSRFLWTRHRNCEGTEQLRLLYIDNEEGDDHVSKKRLL